jgi:hypothetical protein
MERLAELVSKLKEQFDNGADSSKLLATTLLIERELMKAESAPVAAVSSSKVAVVMPAARNGYHKNFAEEPVSENVESSVSPFEKGGSFAEGKTGDLQTPAEFSYNPLTEIPTLSQQHSIKEINELLGIRDASLNDKLKEHKEEIGHKLNGHPIRDLKKAIGINDRFVFINELFRGDEAMYERSLKTINGFRIYAEAEYWIERELKVKLGWLDNNEATKHFYQLIKRRFS